MLSKRSVDKGKVRIPSFCYSLSRVSLVLTHENIEMSGALLSLFYKCSEEILILTLNYLGDKMYHFKNIAH